MKPSKYSRHAAMICLSVRAAADSCIRHYVLQETALFEVGYRYKDADRNPLLRVCFCPSPLLSNLPADSLWRFLDFHGNVMELFTCCRVTSRRPCHHKMGLAR